MTRPSRNADRLMIDAAKKLMSERGVAGLRVREVAKAAGVNLGMFHYHFKTKERFIERVLTTVYGEFFREFQIESGGGGTPIVRLKRAILTIGRFARQNRTLIMPILLEMMGGHKKTLKFAREHLTKHIAILLELVRECQEEGLLQKVPLPMAAIFLVGTVIFPNVVMNFLEKTGAKRPLGHTLIGLESVMLSDEAIERRVDFALKGLSPSKGSL